MLWLVCRCGHSTPLPVDPDNYRCTKCSRVHSVVWCTAERWLTERLKRIFSGLPLERQFGIEWRDKGPS